MKVFASLLYTTVVIALVGSATSDATSDVVETTSDDAATTDCTVVIEEGKSMNETIYDESKKCFFEVGYAHMGANPPDEQIRATLGASCNQKGTLQRCLDRVESMARSCLDETQYTRHRLFDQFTVLDFDIGCEDNGADVAEIYRGTFYGQNKVLKECRKNATAQTIGEIDAVDTNAFMLHRYKEMSKTAECLHQHKAPGEETNWAITMATKLLDRIKCFKDGEDVLCKTIIGQ